VVTEGKDHIGRLLHYYPVESKSQVDDSWCGWHNDHSCLTALTSAMYLN
jgi:isopenicillin N synthase-like dioxygenase